MTKPIKLIVYFSFMLSLGMNFILYKNANESHKASNEALMFADRARQMYRHTTSCEFVPLAFNPPLTFITKNKDEVKMNVKHIFTDIDLQDRHAKIVAILSILEKEVAKHTLSELKENKAIIEKTVINKYNSQTISPVKVFSIVELCI